MVVYEHAKPHNKTSAGTGRDSPVLSLLTCLKVDATATAETSLGTECSDFYLWKLSTEAD